MLTCKNSKYLEMRTFFWSTYGFWVSSSSKPKLNFDCKCWFWICLWPFNQKYMWVSRTLGVKVCLLYNFEAKIIYFLIAAITGQCLRCHRSSRNVLFAWSQEAMWSLLDWLRRNWQRSWSDIHSQIIQHSEIGT